MRAREPVYFFMPQHRIPRRVPGTTRADWSGVLRSGMDATTLYTVAALRDAGFDCEIVGKLPASGIVCAHPQALPAHLPFRAELYLVSMQLDWWIYPYANCHVVANIAQASGLDALAEVYREPVFYIPHWIHAGLVARDPLRGDRFENVAYVGGVANLAEPFRSSAWADQLRGHGLTWIVNDSERTWHDFSTYDAVLFVRNEREFSSLGKPPTKLINAWAAGVPALAGPEIGCRAMRTSELDYVEVRTPQQALNILLRLRDDVRLRRAMIDQARVRSTEFSDEMITRRWLRVFAEIVFPGHEMRRRTSYARKAVHHVAKEARVRAGELELLLAPGYAEERAAAQAAKWKKRLRRAARRLGGTPT